MHRPRDVGRSVRGAERPRVRHHAVDAVGDDAARRGGDLDGGADAARAEKVFKLMARLVRHLDRSDAEVTERGERDKILAELDACKAQLKSQATSAREARS